MKDEEIKQAEADLEKAEAELEMAQAAERKAIQDVEAAVEELQEAENHHREIHITVDGEPVETKHRELTADQIISEFGNQDPATSYLVEIEGNKKESFKGKGDEKIKLHDGLQFQIISTGPKPVSACVGVAAFSEGLSALGYEPRALPGSPDHIVFDYIVEIGKFVGRAVRLGFVVPPDFPNVPPGGPHVSPHILPIHPGNNQTHPLGGVHQSPAPWQSAMGGQWQYWSRPFVNWAQTKKTVAVYMGHIWRLWETQ